MKRSKIRNTKKDKSNQCSSILSEIQNYLFLIDLKTRDDSMLGTLSDCLSYPFHIYAYRVSVKKLCDVCLKCIYHDPILGKFSNGWCVNTKVNVPELPMSAKPDKFVDRSIQ